MKYSLGILLLLTPQIHAYGAEDSTLQKADAQTAECGNFSEVGFKDRDAFLKYLAELKAAQTAEDFGKLVTYPLRVNTKPKPLIIADETALKQNFQDAFSAKVIDSIRKAESKDNFCNYQGMTVGRGKVWIDKKNGRTGIFVINP